MAQTLIFSTLSGKIVYSDSATLSGKAVYSDSTMQRQLIHILTPSSMPNARQSKLH